MPSIIDTRELYGQLSNNSICRQLGKALANPLALALMLTIVMLLVVESSYDRRNRSRFLFRTFAVTAAFMFANNHILMEEHRAKELNRDQSMIFDGISHGGAIVPQSSDESYVVPTAAHLSDDHEDDMEL